MILVLTRILQLLLGEHQLFIRSPKFMRELDDYFHDVKPPIQTRTAYDHFVGLSLDSLELVVGFLLLLCFCDNQSIRFGHSAQQLAANMIFISSL